MTASDFDMNDYKALALRTKSPASEQSLKQLVRSYEVFKDILEESRDQAPLIDKLKRFGIYGKQDSEATEFADQLAPMYPTGDKAERIRQCIDLLHGLIGIIGECGEIAEPLIEYIECNTELDLANLREEGSDILWFLNLILTFAGTDIVATGRNNIKKLKHRYPSKFNLEDYSNRNKPQEMQAFTTGDMVNGLTITD